MNKNRKKTAKSLALIIAVVLVFSMAVGGMLAYLIAEKISVKNSFVPGSVVATIVDDTIRNDGNTEMWVRVAVVGNWKNHKDSTDNSQIVYGRDPNFVVNTEKYGDGEWLKGNVESDGRCYYYWSVPVAPEEVTGKITATPSEQAPAEGYEFSYILGVEAIQAAPPAAFAEWEAVGVKLNDDGTAIIAG